MAIGVYFQPQRMTTIQYDQLMQRLDATGAARPEGRLHHSCFGPPDALMVYDVWDSPESFERFGQTLMPILDDMGIELPSPQVMPIHNMVD